MGKRRKQIVSGAVLLTVLGTIITAAFILAEYVANHPSLQTTIASFGYVGVFLVAVVAGLNVLVPIPAASTVPIFIAAGLDFWLIVTFLTLGTVAADYIGFVFGHLGRDAVSKKYPTELRRFEKIYREKQSWLIPIIFLYAAFVPLPNEAMIIPLAILGVRWHKMFLPLLLGNFVNQALYAIGIHNIFLWLF